MRSREQISRNMSRVRSSGSQIERMLGAAMWAAGIRYRKQYSKVPGRPDFAVVGKKVAIFCDSSFWHGRNWPDAAADIKSNREFWISKIERNIRRDKVVNEQLTEMGWRALRFWDDEITTRPDACVDIVLRAVSAKSLEVKND